MGATRQYTCSLIFAHRVYRKWGSTDAQRDLLEFNARNQVTLWGPTGQISDYAAKAWNGLVGDYYYSRWQLFVSSLYACVGQDPVPPSCDDERFPANYEADLLALEERWQNDRTEYPTQPIGTRLVLCRSLRYCDKLTCG